MYILSALCALGAEKVLSNEIKQLGYAPIGSSPGRVHFSGGEDALYRSNLCLRTADRVYLQLASYTAPDFDALYDGVFAVNWQDYLKKDSRVVVDKVRIYNSALSAERSIQSVVHKAIYAKLGSVWHMSALPETGEEADIRVYLEKDTAQILLDLSGKPLHKRGYRTAAGEAPLRETVAAALLQIMLWRRKTPLHDPFCGAGTIAIEAALYAYNVAPGFGRSFALENLPIHNERLTREIKQQEAAKIRPECEARITGSDKDPAVIELAKTNAEYACVTAGRALQLTGSDQRIQRPDFTVADYSELAAPYETGMIITNPPYGERMGDEDEIRELYSGMKSLFESFPGWDMGFITAHTQFEQLLGKHSTRKKNLKSGALDTIFYHFTGKQQKKTAQ